MKNDWYNYGGDISTLRHLQVIKPILSEKEAEDIYILKKREKLHEDIADWEKRGQRSEIAAFSLNMYIF